MKYLSTRLIGAMYCLGVAFYISQFSTKLCTTNQLAACVFVAAAFIILFTE